MPVDDYPWWLHTKVSKHASWFSQPATSCSFPPFFLWGGVDCLSIVIFLLAFYEYKKKTCSLFARSFNIMLLTFDQVCRTGIEILTKCEQRNIAHMYVISHIQKHAILQLVFCSLFTNTKRKAVLSSPAHSAWCYCYSIKLVRLESKYWRNASGATSRACVCYVTLKYMQFCNLSFARF